MALIFQKSAVSRSHPTKGHTKALPVLGDLNKPGRLKVGHLLTLFSISHSGLYEGIKKERYPKPDGKDGVRPYWLHETIRPYLQKAV